MKRQIPLYAGKEFLYKQRIAFAKRWRKTNHRFATICKYSRTCVQTTVWMYIYRQWKMPLRQLHGMVFARCWICTILRTILDSSVYITLNGLNDTIRRFFLFRCIEARLRASMLMVTGIVDTVPSRYNNLYITASSWRIFVIAKGFLSTQEKTEMLWMCTIKQNMEHFAATTGSVLSILYKQVVLLVVMFLKHLPKRAYYIVKGTFMIQSTLISKSSIWLQVE